MNMFENHELVVEIHKTLRDHGVLKNDAPLNTLTSDERAFLEEVDQIISDQRAYEKAMAGTTGGAP